MQDVLSVDTFHHFSFVHVNTCSRSLWNISIISMCHSSEAASTCRPHSSWVFAGFTVFTNSMNNYPGVAANSEKTRQTLPGYRPQPTSRKPAEPLTKPPAHSSVAPFFSHFLSSLVWLFFLLLLSLFLSVFFSMWIAGFVWSFRVPFPPFVCIYFSFFPFPRLFLDHGGKNLSRK